MKNVFVSLIVIFACGGVFSESLENKSNFDQKCGVEASTNLIHHNPWLTFLEFYRGKHQTEIRCAGSLVDPLHVITAAHCVKKLKFTRLVARLGEYDVKDKTDCVDGVCADPLVRLNVVDIIVHPEYDGNDHDIAILRLEKEAPYTDFIRPICLPSGKVGQDVTFSAAGWGEIPHMGSYSHIKKIVPLPKWEWEQCQKTYSQMAVPKTAICAGGEEGLDTCRGDSGGPLTLVKDQVELYGVTSAGNIQCGAKGYPGIYTSVFDSLDWIYSILNKNKAD